MSLDKCSHWKFINPSGKEFITLGVDDDFCKEHNLSKASIYKASKLGYKHKGWKITKL